MKRTAKNERTNEQNATKRRCGCGGVGEKTARASEFSRAFRRSTAALALTCGVCVGVSGCQSFLGADERFRQGRGEYALNDEAVLRDWEQAARETGKTTRNGEVDESGRKVETGQDAGKDPAASRPVLRSAAFDNESEERRVASRKPISGDPLFEEPEAPKTFSERVKGLFSRSKKEEGRSSNSRNGAAVVISGNSSNFEKSQKFARSGESKKTARSVGNSFSLGRGLPNVFSSSKRRGREKFPVDPVLQYDESRFMPSFQTCEQYYSPLVPVERPLTSAETAAFKKLTQSGKPAQTVRTAQGKRDSARVSGRELVAKSEKRRTSSKNAFDGATNGVASSTASATGWGKTRPIAVAANEESANAKPSVASVGFLDISRKNETKFQTLTTRCDGFFGWESDQEELLNAISGPSQGRDANLTAYSTAPSPTAPVFPISASAAFATEVAEIATGNEENANLGQDAPTLTADVLTQETAALQNVSPSPIASLTANESTSEIDETAGDAQTPESAANVPIAQKTPVLTAYSPSATRSGAGERSDFASQLGESGFDWFDSQAKNDAVRPAIEPPTVATFEAETASNAPTEKLENETLELVAGTPRVDLDAALANRLAPIPVAAVEEGSDALAVAPAPVAAVEADSDVFPVAPAPVAAVEEGSDALAVAPAPVAAVEVGSDALPVAEILPSAPTSVDEVAQALTPVAVETLDVEAPRALAAVEEGVGEENGVAGPNFALAAPGLGAGESIQGAADERKNAAVAKPLTGDEIAWVEQIKSAIQTLVAERDAKKAAGEDVRRLDARLRLLYLAVDEYDRSIQEIQDDADPLKVFWETERGDLETLLQSRLEEIDPTFVAERLRAGLDSLSGLCDLQIRKSVLAVAPACFGLYEERNDAYRPGETVFAYAELEYVSCRETDEGRLIDVECRWRLLNADGSELTPVEARRCSNLSETKLRDVVLNVSAPLPNDLAPGTYLLEMEVVDMNRPDAKPAKKRLELTVVAGENAETAAE